MTTRGCVGGLLSTKIRPSTFQSGRTRHTQSSSWAAPHSGTWGVRLKSEEYTYDGQNRRIGVLTDLDGAGPQAATQLRTAYQGDNAWADFDGAGVLQTRYLFGQGMDSLVARTAAAGGSVGWYLADNLGSVRLVVTTGGVVLYAASYTAFGQVKSAAGAGGDRFGYTGREWSRVTGDGYYRARQYDPAVGRFLSQDPIQFSAHDANLYRYVGNVPTSGVDPSGLMTVWGMCLSVYAGAVGAAYGAAGGAIGGALAGGPRGAVVGAVIGGVLGLWATGNAITEDGTFLDRKFPTSFRSAWDDMREIGATAFVATVKVVWIPVFAGLAVRFGRKFITIFI